MVRIWIDEFEQEVICNALRNYKQDAEENAQWTVFVDAVDRICDKVFHAGDEDDG